MDGIAVVGMACCYPDAESPVAFWENVLASRRSFRRIPSERVRLEDYGSSDRHAPDRTYLTHAAVIQGYSFDRTRFRIGASSLRSADLAHWLALDVASRALADAGFAEGSGLPRETTGVVLGNTLTGEFSRANVMRLRWPYVERVLGTILEERGLEEADRTALLGEFERRYKAPFPPLTEETLAGGLSNTIAGRICNYFDFKGGGYSIDGACASSLLAVTSGCAALCSKDLDVVLAGGVDLSLDPFELVGFAKMGALAGEEMRVFDVRSAGFWPGEGCGFVVLMRYADALTRRARVYAVIRGWGVSSDGSGGLTRPEVAGQLLALRRAYARAGYGIDTVSYFEGHGTGTEVGDEVELRTISLAIRESGPLPARAAAIGSIKANIGHTKAAAGVAGLIKAAMAVHTQALPPTTGCGQPHPELTGERAVLRVLTTAEPWPQGVPVRAGVSAMGFGGINTHVTLEGVAKRRRARLDRSEIKLLACCEDSALFLFAGETPETLLLHIKVVEDRADALSLAELGDLSATLATTLTHGRIRAAVVASTPKELGSRLALVRASLERGATSLIDADGGVFLGVGESEARVGFLFPGQGTAARPDGGLWSRRFTLVRQLYKQADLDAAGDPEDTEAAQPAIVTASAAGLRVLQALGVRAVASVGHSVGELTALHWAGAIAEDALLRIARVRGRTMKTLGRSGGMMASLGAGLHEVNELLTETAVVIAAENSPRQTVVAGEQTAVEAVMAAARARGFPAARLQVSHAFHSPLMADAGPALGAYLRHEKFEAPHHQLASTVTGNLLSPEEDLRALLVRQVTNPVRFVDAVRALAPCADLWIEVGPGRTLSRLLPECDAAPAIAIEAGGLSLRGLWSAVGAAFALGSRVRLAALFRDRFWRPLDLNRPPSFFASPCELAPSSSEGHQETRPERGASPRAPTEAGSEAPTALDLVRQLVASHVELPTGAVEDRHRLLADLHLNSIAVAEIVVEAARALDVRPPRALTDYATATVVEIARTLDDQCGTGSARDDGEAGAEQPAGVGPWVRCFTPELVEVPLDNATDDATPGPWRVVTAHDSLLRSTMERAFGGGASRGGTVVCLPTNPDERHVGLLLDGLLTILRGQSPPCLVVVQHGGGGAAFARSVRCEMPELTVCVVDVPDNHPEAVHWVRKEAEAARGYVEAHYDAHGRRYAPMLRLAPLDGEPSQPALGPGDVVLATGGGKGITAECTLALARETGAAAVLVGRGDPSDDEELATNLERFRTRGIRFRYVRADVTELHGVRAAVAAAQEVFGAVTVILHGAGANVPGRLQEMDEAKILRTLAPKVQGLRNVLSAVDPSRLRVLVAFGSIIARLGMEGEADYALANEWLGRLVQQFQGEHPECRGLVLEWSAWSAVGMAMRLGRLDALARAGVSAITPDEGVAVLSRLLRSACPATPVVVTGRFGEPQTVRLERPELPLLRFLERPRVYYPGVELVVEFDLSFERDPYLQEHVLQGVALMPAVMALEAIAQAVIAVTGSPQPPTFENIEFLRPIVVRANELLTVRIAVLVRDASHVDAAVRSAETDFQADHVRASCHVGYEERVAPLHDEAGLGPEAEGAASAASALQPDTDLYGRVLFQTGRFQRVARYRKLRGTECMAEVGSGTGAAWFAPFLPQTLVLGDPAARDACIHALQACIPHGVVLPVRIGRLMPTEALGSWSHVVRGIERARETGFVVYDVDVSASDGRVCEQWRGLRLQVLPRSAEPEPWPPPLLVPYIERRVGDLAPGSAVSVAVEVGPSVRRTARSRMAMQRALGGHVRVIRRPDGRPQAVDGRSVSASHASDLTLAVAGPGLVACDVEIVTERSEMLWRELLGEERWRLAVLVQAEAHEELNAGATRVWSAGECLKKVSAVDGPLVFRAAHGDGVVLLAFGSTAVVTFTLRTRGVSGRLVVAVLTGVGPRSDAGTREQGSVHQRPAAVGARGG